MQLKKDAEAMKVAGLKNFGARLEEAALLIAQYSETEEADTVPEAEDDTDIAC